MINKLYAKIKKFIKEEWKTLLIYSLIILVSTYKFPYYIDATGGMLDASKRVEIENSYKMEGEFHMAYVNEMPATIPMMIVSLFNKDWDIIPKEDVVSINETVSEASTRGKLYLESTLSNAVYYAFKEAGLETTITNKRVSILYKTEESKTDLKIGDMINSINNNSVITFDNIGNELKKYKPGQKINLEVTDYNGKKKKRYAIISDDRKIGIIIKNLFDIKTDPKVEFTFQNRESGPSGGLITTLMVYNLLTKDDITNGKKIAGTGTIEEDGTVGEIGGIKYKLAGVVKEKVDLFICPAGSNYEEAMKLKKENNYDIKIIGVSTFEEALNYLNNEKRRNN